MIKIIIIKKINSANQLRLKERKKSETKKVAGIDNNPNEINVVSLKNNAIISDKNNNQVIIYINFLVLITREFILRNNPITETTYKHAIIIGI